MASYCTTQGRARAEIVEKKSRFIATVQHVETEEEALAFLDEIRSEHRMARHNVYAYVLRENGRVRYSDDGEPQKTAGMPTLEAIQHAGLTDVAVVVTRYFGGILLGTGGLVRAYTTATQRAIEAAREAGLVVEKTLVVGVEVGVPYAMFDRVRDLAERSGAHVASCDYAADVTLSLVFRAGEETPFVDAMRELMDGQDVCLVGEPEFSEF